MNRPNLLHLFALNTRRGWIRAVSPTFEEQVEAQRVLRDLSDGWVPAEDHAEVERMITHSALDRLLARRRGRP